MGGTRTGQKDAKGRNIIEGERGGLYVLVNGKRLKPATGGGIVGRAVSWAKGLGKKRADKRADKRTDERADEPGPVVANPKLARPDWARRRRSLGLLARTVGRIRPDAVWDSVRTYQEIMLAMYLYVRGVLKVSPTYLDPLEQDQRDFVAKDLALVNARGFVTDNGQASLDSVEKRDGKFVRTQQKSYLSGFLPKAHLGPLSAFMARRRDVAYAFAQTVDLESYQNILFNTFPEGSYVVTRFRSAAAKEGKEALSTLSNSSNVPWENFSYIHHDKRYLYRSHLDEYHDYVSIQWVFRSECMYVDLASSREFGQGPSMESVMLEYLDTPEARKLTAAYRFA